MIENLFCTNGSYYQLDGEPLDSCETCLVWFGAFVDPVSSNVYLAILDSVFQLFIQMVVLLFRLWWNRTVYPWMKILKKQQDKWR